MKEEARRTNKPVRSTLRERRFMAALSLDFAGEG
jgi:hypothetical protein